MSEPQPGSEQTRSVGIGLGVLVAHRINLRSRRLWRGPFQPGAYRVRGRIPLAACQSLEGPLDGKLIPGWERHPVPVGN
jgi:hypothetical protein